MQKIPGIQAESNLILLKYQFTKQVFSPLRKVTLARNAFIVTTIHYWKILKLKVSFYDLLICSKWSYKNCFFLKIIGEIGSTLNLNFCSFNSFFLPLWNFIVHFFSEQKGINTLANARLMSFAFVSYDQSTDRDLLTENYT